MKANIGTTDRSIRLIAGLALIALAVAGIIGAWGYLGVVALLTAAARVCPAYLPLGINTCGADKKP